MSIRINLAAAALAVGLASLFGQGSATADPSCPARMRYSNGYIQQCYYLPTVANGRVTGVQAHTGWKPYEPPVVHHHPQPHGPYYTPPAAAAVGGHTVGPCRFLPTVANGRVTGSHQVCG